MCTVSFIRIKDSVILTSNRDEHIQRETAAAPDYKLVGDRNTGVQKKIFFPRDAKAGGTWFVAADSGTVAVLLNGAFEKHVTTPPYRKSRGLVLLEMIEAGEACKLFKLMDLANIEPFTVILYEAGRLYELKWDGKNKYATELDVQRNFIWSSVTLYSAEVIAEREKRFEHFLRTETALTSEMIHEFHNSNEGDSENGFIINRATGMKTFSITQAVVSNNLIDFIHTDLLQHRQFEEVVPINHQLQP